jgi:hypothetical protein
LLDGVGVGALACWEVKSREDTFAAREDVNSEIRLGGACTGRGIAV